MSDRSSVKEKQHKLPHVRKKHDALLKTAIEDCFSYMLRFFYKDADQQFDMGREFKSMDKELREIIPDRLVS